MSAQFDADVLVIGSGVLGSLAAHSLARAGKSVIMLEAGARMPRWRIVENFRNAANKANFRLAYPGSHYPDENIENVGPVAFRAGMLKLVGGTTWAWGGASWRYLPNDMRIKTLYGVGRDWPLDYETLEPWYTRAEQALGVCGNADDDQSGRGGGAFPPRSQAFPLPMLPWSPYTREFAAKAGAAGFRFCDEPNARASQPYEGRPACCGMNNCTPICPIGAQYSGDVHATLAEHAGARLIENAVAFKLERAAGGKIAAVHYRSPDGGSTRLAARCFIVAANGLETAKLLLLSEVANSSDQVGRNLMDHAGTDLVMLAKDELWPGRGPVRQGSICSWRDGSFRRQHAAFRHSLGNAVPNAAVTARALREGLIGPELDARIRHDAARYVRLATLVETLPLPTNRLTLSEHKDALGLPKLRIHYDIGDYVRAGAAVAQQDYGRLVATFAAERLSDTGLVQNHHNIMGSTIMGADPANSVVDADCRSHDHENLFLATTGVIPAAGVVEPTLAAAALSLRMAELIGRTV
jgi:choline dehydrogenase-like flavoprotein